MLDVVQISKRFGRIHAVRDVTFSVPTGSVVGVLGPNGAGKSTTIRMVTGVLPPSAGAVSVDGLDTIDRAQAARRRIGYLPEANPLYPEMRVASYLRYRARLFGLTGRRGGDAVERVLGRCWLSDVRRRRCGELSKGYRQRVGLAAALLHDPPLLVLDEPTSGLDPTQISETRRLIAELAGDHTMLIVSHILPEVEKSCDRLLIFAGGRIRADGTQRDLLRDRSGGHTFDVEAEIDPARAAELARAAGAELAGEPTPAGGWCAFAARFASDSEAGGERLGRTLASRGVVVRRLERRRPTLEQVYAELIEGPTADEAKAIDSDDASEQEAA